MLSSAGAQDIDTSEYQLFDLHNAGFYWENDQLGLDTVFRPRFETSFFPFEILTNLRWLHWLKTRI